MITTQETFKRARNRGVPIVGIETPDPAATCSWIEKSLNGKSANTPIVLWDIIRGFTGLNEMGQSLASELTGELPKTNPSEALGSLLAAPSGCVIAFSNAPRYLESPDVMQGVWNVRDPFKQKQSTLVLLGSQIKLPPELSQDCIILSEELPGEVELGKIVDSIVKDAALPDNTITATDRPRVIDTLRGLSAFAAEQVTALSLTKTGVDLDSLWSRKAKMVEQTPGLAVWRGGETFADLGGLSNLKDFLTRVLTSGKTPVRAILYLDEAEKSLAGAGGDTSGTSQDQLGVLLQMMQDKGLPGIILVGPPGTGKSSIAKAAGTVANAPVIACDLGAMKGSLVGQSEARIRAAMDVFQAISKGKGIAIATCNKLVALPPELKRRFSLGTFYIDLPTSEEQQTIWPLWLKRYDLPKQDLPACDGWTGAEIRACCDVAFRTGYSLKEAATYVVPVCKSAADQIEQLRKLATGKFISANYKGPFRYEPQAGPATGARKMELA